MGLSEAKWKGKGHKEIGQGYKIWWSEDNKSGRLYNLVKDILWKWEIKEE